MLFHNAEGEYEPSFFVIRVKSDAAVESVADENLSTFIHEYIHFLQDLTLPYCIRENLVHLREFFVLVDQVSERNAIHLPCILADDDLTVTRCQTDLTWGGGKKIGRAHV